MTITVANVTFDCDSPRKVADFWSAALGRPQADNPSDFFVAIPPTDEAPGLFFIKVPEPKSSKNRVHLDLSSNGNRGAEVERLLELGASRVGDYEEWGHSWTTLCDVEGNEFCVA
jgi:hypothetical protein